MFSVFNLEKLLRLLRDFHRITGIRITVFDRDCTELVSYPENLPAFCGLIRHSAAGRAACDACDKAACLAAIGHKTAYVYRCHAGLTEAVMPLQVGDAVVGFLLFGHIYGYDDPEEGASVIKALCACYPVDTHRLLAASTECPRASADYIESAAHILHATASFLVLERMATLREDSVAARLDAYLSSHFAEHITAEALCKHLGIGRSKLYRIADQLYGCGIFARVRSLRIEHAQHLLVDHPEKSISDIGTACGFHDYTYFISVFTKENGVPPGAYRKANS